MSASPVHRRGLAESGPNLHRLVPFCRFGSCLADLDDVRRLFAGGAMRAIFTDRHRHVEYRAAPFRSLERFLDQWNRRIRIAEFCELNRAVEVMPIQVERAQIAMELEPCLFSAHVKVCSQSNQG